MDRMNRMYGILKVTTLIVDGLVYHSTWDSTYKAEAAACRGRWAKHGKTLVLKDFYVHIHTINPKTGEVLTWDKGQGYSLWEKL